MAAPKQDDKPRRDRAHWSHWASWLAGGFAIAANVLGVVQVASAAIN